MVRWRWPTRSASLGREGVDLAAYWVFPPPDSPAGQAFAMYTHYDASGDSFGDRAVAATVDASPDYVTSYASLDSQSGDVVIIAINKRDDAASRARSELCSGQKCPQFERCFITAMHQRAQESDIIIVNHHLFFADLAVKGGPVGGEGGGGIIPDYGAVIFDEAHDIEDVAGQYFGTTVSTYQFEELTRDVAGVAHRKNFGSKELDRILMTLGERSAHFSRCLERLKGAAASARTKRF